MTDPSESADAFARPSIVFNGVNDMTTTNVLHQRLVPALALLLAGSALSAPAAKPAATSYAQGTLQYGQRVYYPQGCVHNGNRAVCSFTFVNQGQPLTVNAGIGGSELTGISFVDNGHVPHAPDAAYFIDPFGSQRNQLFLNKNDTGLMTVEFKDVDPAVTSGEFHLRDQIVGRIGVSQPNYNAQPGAAAPAGTAQVAAAAPQMPQGQPAQAQIPQTTTAAPCVAGTSSCNAQTKVNAAQANVAGWAGLVNSFKTMVPSAPAAAPAPAPSQQVTQPQVQALQPQAPGLTPQQLQALQLQQAGQSQQPHQ
jgi:hypothetical protein